jgi:hypothetical protein
VLVSAGFAPLVWTIGACSRPEPISESFSSLIQDLPRLTVTEELRIGSMEDPDYGFSRIGTVDVDVDGRIYVFELQDREIRVYSSDGALLHTIGGPGDGPGEFRTGARFGVEGDTVWAIESLSRRITLFDRRGQVLATTRFQPEGIQWYLKQQRAQLVPGMMLPGGQFSSQVQTLGVPAGVGFELERDTIVVPRVRFDMSGHVIDTIGTYVDRNKPPELQYINVGRGRYPVPVTPPSLPFSLETREGRIVVETPEATVPARAEMRIHWHDHRDSIIRTRTYSYRPSRFTGADLDAVAAFYVRQGTQDAPPGAETRPRASAADSAAAHKALRDQMVFPEFKPPFRRTHIGADGALWFQMDDPATTHTWVALDTNGQPLGQFALPVGVTSIVWSKGEHFLAVVRDDLDVPWLVAYRLDSHPIS